MGWVTPGQGENGTPRAGSRQERNTLRQVKTRMDTLGQETARVTALGRQPGRVEAAGIEPASRDISAPASTCVADFLGSRRSGRQSAGYHLDQSRTGISSRAFST